MATLNGKCLSDKERLHVNTVHTNRGLEKYDVNVAESNLAEEEMPGIVSMEEGFGSRSNGFSGGIMALIIICSVSIFIFLVVIGIFKYRQ